MSIGWRVALLFAFVAPGFLLAQVKPAPEEEEDSPAEAGMERGEKLARRACVKCHAFVEPNMLTRKNWREQILPRMAVRLGVAAPDYSKSPEGELLRARKIYTDKPLVPVAWWPSIEAYYLEHAPEEPLPQDPHPAIEIGLPQFKSEVLRFRTPHRATTLVKFRPGHPELFVGDDKARALYLLDHTGRLLTQFAVDNVPSDVVERPEGLYVVGLGSFLPSEKYRAEVMLFPRKGDGFGEKKVILKELPRSTQIEFADFNADGRADFALCMFGDQTGRFSWFENLGGDQYREHELSGQTGAIGCAARDFDGDGRPDLAVLFAQHLESLLLVQNGSEGKWKASAVFQKSPVFGHTSLEVVDFDRDGFLDILVTNGDNGEYESPLKKYHGVWLYRGLGAGRFEERFLFPLNGAYRALARDFDGDGDLDIAVISYFPDYVSSPRESFVLLEQVSPWKFVPRTFRECIAGRWLVMDAGDFDGDGDPDIALGSYADTPFFAPPFLKEAWQKFGPSVLVLRNTRTQGPGAPDGAAPGQSPKQR